MSSNENVRERNLKTYLKEVSERETYTHGIIWKSVSFFSLLISGLITVGFSIISLSLHAVFGIIVLALFFTFVGHYVLVKEGGYFQEYRYEVLKIRELLDYYKIEDLKNTTEFRDFKLGRKGYLKKYTAREGGVRFVFKILWLFQAVMCLFLYLVSLIALGLEYQRATVPYSSFEWIVIAMLGLFFLFLNAIVIGWYQWEIKSLFKKLRTRMCRRRTIPLVVIALVAVGMLFPTAHIRTKEEHVKTLYCSRILEDGESIQVFWTDMQDRTKITVGIQSNEDVQVLLVGINNSDTFDIYSLAQKVHNVQHIRYYTSYNVTVWNPILLGNGSSATMSGSIEAYQLSEFVQWLPWWIQ